MTRYNVMLYALLASFIIVIIGAYLKITHNSNGDDVMMVGGVLYILAAVLAIYEVMRSGRIGMGQKILWLFCFILLGMIGMFIYLLVGRKNVVDSETATLQA